MYHSNPLKVAVAGATGKQGGAVARSLLEHGHNVQALSRNPRSPAAKTLEALGAQIVYTDLAKPTTLDGAVAGCDALFAVTTPFQTSVEVEIEQGYALIKAAKQQGIKHVVFSSAAQANLATRVPHFESKYQIEKYLSAARSLSWTIIAPAAFMDDFASGWYKHALDQGTLSMVMQENSPLQFICSEDIGAFAALAIEQPARFAGQRLDIAGDELTGPQLAALFTKAYQRPITYQQVPLEIARSYSSDLAAMFDYFEKVGLHIDIARLHKTYPEVALHSFESWIAGRQWKGSEDSQTA